MKTTAATLAVAMAKRTLSTERNRVSPVAVISTRSVVERTNPIRGAR